MKRLACLLVPALVLVACGDDDSTSDPTGPTGDVPASIGGIIDSEPSGDVDVLGFVVIDEGGTRLCSVLLESFPPQCVEPAVDLVDLDPAAIDLREEQGVQWTDDVVVLRGRYAAGALTVTADG